jgi:hypothetical protein
MMHDAKLPSATACIAGAPIRGSWWGHAKGTLIFETLTGLEATDTVAWTKLVLGKETLVHRRLWPALLAAAASGQPWQTRGLKPDAKQLLRRVRLGKPLQTDAKRAATDLERRLLAHSYTEHTASGRHVRFLETWASWGRRAGIAKADLPEAADAIQALSEPVMAWMEGQGGRPPGLLPWLASR